MISFASPPRHLLPRCLGHPSPSNPRLSSRRRDPLSPLSLGDCALRGFQCRPRCSLGLIPPPLARKSSTRTIASRDMVTLRHLRSSASVRFAPTSEACPLSTTPAFVVPMFYLVTPPACAKAKFPGRLPSFPDRPQSIRRGRPTWSQPRSP